MAQIKLNHQHRLLRAFHCSGYADLPQLLRLLQPLTHHQFPFLVQASGDPQPVPFDNGISLLKVIQPANRHY